MKHIILVFACFLTVLSYAQPPGRGKGGPSVSGEIFGTIIDSTSNKPMGYVTVLAKKQSDNSMTGGVVSSPNGNFSITNLPAGKYNLEIAFVGYNKKFVNGISINTEQSAHNLKNIIISPKVLDEVEVIGEKPVVTYEIDKKIINVEDQITNINQTAIEVLENAPSVTVDADGNVSLRGSSSFTLLIDGIPTAMDANDALATIPASTIKDIEIITNPSAKFDAEGTSGVINIITKKNKLEGMSLLANFSAGTFANNSADVAINLKKNKFTFNVAANIGQRGRPNDRYTSRTSIYGDTLTNLLISEGESNWRNNFRGIKGEVQWAPNNSHVLIAKTNFNTRLMNPYSDFNYENYDNGELTNTFFTEQHNYIALFGSTSSLFYQYNINRNKQHNITFKAILSLRDVVQDDTTTNYNDAGEIESGNLYTETGPSNFTRYNIDYKLPLKNDQKFETGIQTQFGTSGDVGKNYVYNTTTQSYDLNELFSSSVDYTRDVYAGYAMYSGKLKSLGYQAGLRAEYTDRSITSTTLGDFAEVKRLDWFPSAHLSYSLENKSQVLMSYSRRIQRPRSYYFEPFITWEGPFNVRTGNPNLTPEYINAFEISFIQPLKNRSFLSLETYYRTVSNIIRRISTVYEPSILISKPYNIGTSNSIGIEPSINYNATKWWKINAGANIYMFMLSGIIEGVDYSTESFNWDGRITNTFTIDGWILQLNSRYNSRTVTAQGESQDYFTQDVSLKKGFDNNKYAFTLSGRNILNTQKRINTVETQNVIIYSERIPLYPIVSLTFSLKLNNYQKVYERNEQLDDF